MSTKNQAKGLRKRRDEDTDRRHNIERRVGRACTVGSVEWREGFWGQARNARHS